MIGNKQPYNAGELRQNGSALYLICGHIWWPVEKKNAYHVLRANPDGTPKNDTPEYVWDYTNDWSLVQPMAA